jgi:putative transposase
MSYTFLPQVRFLWQKQTFIVRRQLPDQQVVIEDLTSGVVSTLPRQELEQALFTGELRFEIQGSQARPNPDGSMTTQYTYLALDDCTDRQQTVARLRLTVIEPLLLLAPKDRTRERLEAHIAEIQATFSPQELDALGCRQLSRATLYRWLKLYIESGHNLRGLIPQTQNCGSSGQSRLHPEVDQVIQNYFVEIAGIRTRRTITYIYEEICLRVQEINTTRAPHHQLVFPSKMTVARRFQTFRRQPHYQPSTQRQYRAFEKPYQPLERVEIDHTLTDLVVVDDEDHLPLGRLTLTLCIDVGTRYPLGYHLGFDRYSYFAISECLYHAIQPKSTRQRYGTQHEWLAYGVPHTLVTDNGREFLGQEMEDACHLLGIHLTRTPPRSPHLKPFIERLFATCNTGFFHVAPGTTFSNLAERGDYDSKKMACVYRSQIDQAFNLFFVDIYAQSYHTGLRTTPAQAWQQALQSGFVPQLPANVEELRILLGHILHRVIRRSGIEFTYLRYNSPELLHLRLKLDGQPAKIKFLPSDLSMVYVYNPFEHRYLTVPSLDPTYTRGLSLWKHRLIVQQAHQTGRTIDRIALAAARRQIQAIFQEGAQQRHQGRRLHKPVPPRETKSPPQLVAPVDTPDPDLQLRLLENERLATAWKHYQNQLQSSQEDWRSWDLGDLQNDFKP